MVLNCFVPGCSPKTRKGRVVSFHHLPVKDWERCKQWLRAINHPKYGEDTGAVNLKNLRVCSLHFKPEDCESNVLGMKRTALKDTAIPSIFTFPTDDEQPVLCRKEIVKDLPLLASSGQSSLTKKPSTQTPVRIQAKPESDRRLAKTIIDIGSAFALWQKFRDENGFKADAELAFYLLRRTAYCADLSARRKKRKLDPLPDVASEECESESSQPRNGHHCTDEEMEIPEICCEVPPPSQTDEPAQTEIKSKDQLGSEDQLRLENQIKQEDQPRSEDQIKQEDQMRLEDRIKSEDQLRSEKQIKSEDQPKSEGQIKLEDQSVAPALNNEDIVPECSKNEIKEEPVETKVQPENRLEIRIDSVTTSDKITPSFVQTVNSVSMEVKEEHRRTTCAQ